MTTDPMRKAQRGDIPADSFAARLMLARMHAGHLSIRDAAERCSLGRGAWTNWEKGALPGDIIGVATVIADKLDIDRDWLLFGGALSEDRQRVGSRGSADPNRVSDQVSRLRTPASTARQTRPAHRPTGRTSGTQRRPVGVRSPGHTMPTSHAA